MSAGELAEKLDSVREGNSVIRSRMEIQLSNTGKRTLQLQIKERRTKSATDVAYQVLWPNEHKGEAVILHQSQGGNSGSIIIPKQPVRSINGSQMNEGLFDSDLSYQDAVENFFAWKKQAIVGSEAINGVNCQILESKPDSPSASPYARVRSWIDPQRLVRCGSRNIQPPAISSGESMLPESRVTKNTSPFQPVSRCTAPKRQQNGI
jgi:hypothetical protein